MLLIKSKNNQSEIKIINQVLYHKHLHIINIALKLDNNDENIAI